MSKFEKNECLCKICFDKLELKTLYYKYKGFYKLQNYCLKFTKIFQELFVELKKKNKLHLKV